MQHRFIPIAMVLLGLLLACGPAAAEGVVDALDQDPEFLDIDSDGDLDDEGLSTDDDGVAVEVDLDDADTTAPGAEITPDTPSAAVETEDLGDDGGPLTPTDVQRWRRYRADFLVAERALRQGALTRYETLAANLRDYPLYPYLQYEYLRRRLARLPRAEVEVFLEMQEGAPLGARMHRTWITHLIRNGRWQDVIDYYRPGDHVSLECYYRWALYQTGDLERAFAGMERLWLVGKSQPRACDRIFTAWHQQGEISTELAWQRIRLAMNAGRTRLARYLKRYLPPEEQHWADLWLSVHRNPQLIRNGRHFTRAHPLRNTILLHGIKRLALKDPDLAIETWDQILTAHYQFTDSEYNDTERQLAMALAVRGKPEAIAWLAVIDDTEQDTSLREWRVRASLNQENWHAALAWIYQLTEDERMTPRWQYWQARALAELNQDQQAEEIFINLALSRSFYGFLAADRLDLPYQLNHQALDPAHSDPFDIADYSGLMRARELYFLGRIVDARREWYHATRDMAEWQLQAAARLAHQWGWHDRAIVTVARTDNLDDMEIRFPLAHREHITAEARVHDLDPALVFGIIRQESAFTPDARSSAGALGLMQLMPRTARQVARRINVRLPNNNALLDVGTNLQLGMAHLKRVLDQFDQHPVLATAAYNAGQHRVRKWIPQEGVIDADIWMETVPFHETRNYVENVLAFTAIYAQRIGQANHSLQARMPPIRAEAPLLSKQGRQAEDDAS